MKARPLLGLLPALWAVLALSPPAIASPGHSPGSAYASLRDAAYGCAPIGQLESLSRHAGFAVEAAGMDAPDRAYWLSRVQYMVGRWYHAWGYDAEAARHYAAGLDLAAEALEAGEFSDGWRMMSENLGQLCALGDLAYRLAHGPKVLRYARRAAELDPDNVPAQILLAAAKVYPPPIAGGNPAVGLRLMRRALELGATAPDDLFNIYSGIGLAHAKLGEVEAAARWFEKALGLYPGNLYVRGEYETLSR